MLVTMVIILGPKGGTMWATQRSAELTRRLKGMGLFDRWSEIRLDHFEACTGITCEDLGGPVLHPGDAGEAGRRAPAEPAPPSMPPAPSSF
jgi:hypothetical protein